MLTGVLAGCGSAAYAQELFAVTGLSQPGVAALDTADGARWELSVGRPVIPGRIEVADGGQLMLFEPSGAVVIALGPASVAVAYEEGRDEIQLELRNGKLLLASSRQAGVGRAIAVTARTPAQPPLSVDVLVGLGQTCVYRDEDRVGVAYVAEEVAAPIVVGVGGSSISLSSGQLLTVDPAAGPQVGPLANWLAEQGFERTCGRDLGVASAQMSRRYVETSLFENIIAWDRYAGAPHVAARLREQRFSLEIRQTVQTVTTPTRPISRGGPVPTEPFPAANEVPPLSPAAASVQNLRQVGQGVTAIELNRRAATLLELTGSQGLGFRGLRNLAIPGFSPGGVRTTGPAGLGAQH
jgi:hypothetical protein